MTPVNTMSQAKIVRIILLFLTIFTLPFIRSCSKESTYGFPVVSFIDTSHAFIWQGLIVNTVFGLLLIILMMKFMPRVWQNKNIQIGCYASLAYHALYLLFVWPIAIMKSDPFANTFTSIIAYLLAFPLLFLSTNGSSHYYEWALKTPFYFNEDDVIFRLMYLLGILTWFLLAYGIAKLVRHFINCKTKCSTISHENNGKQKAP